MLKILISSLCLTLVTQTTVVNAQDSQSWISGSDNPSDLDQPSIQQPSEVEVDNSTVDYRDNLNSQALEALVLMRALRALVADTEPLASDIKDIFEPEELEFLIADLNAAVDFALQTTSLRKKALCDSWNELQGIRNNAVDISLDAYREENQRIQPLISEQFQNALIGITLRSGSAKMNAFVDALESVRSRYSNANSTTLDQLLRHASNREERLDALCD